MKPGSGVVLALAGLIAGCSHSKPQAAAADAQKESGLVHISAEAQKNFGLQVEPAQVRDLHEYLQAPGTVRPIDSHVNTVRPLARGRLHDVLVRVGDRVKRANAGHLRQHRGRRIDGAVGRRNSRTGETSSSGAKPRALDRTCSRPGGYWRCPYERIRTGKRRAAGFSTEHQIAGERRSWHRRAAAALRNLSGGHEPASGHSDYVATEWCRNQTGSLAGRSHRIVVGAFHNRRSFVRLGAGGSL
jgi:hypothetical protein